ncbi:MAG: VCBS repeat-containing protein, partial [Chloroflexota bacterium]
MVRLYFKLITLMLTIVLVPMGHAQDVSVDTNAHLEGTCSGVFIRQELPHVTTVDTDPIRMFESNGAGLALGDLNADGLTDIVLANLDGPETVLWNRGDLMFDAAALDIPGRTRAAIIIDVDADGLRDIVFTSQRAAPSLWRNMGEESFEFAPLSGVSKPAYAMNWADLDADGDLDLVTGSYDAELARIMSNEFLFGENNGVFVYINEDGDYTAIRLSESAQALAILLTDLNGDNAPDIAV